MDSLPERADVVIIGAGFATQRILIDILAGQKARRERGDVVAEPDAALWEPQHPVRARRADA